MGATGIEWTIGPNGEPGFTFNPWIGCTKILGSDPQQSACLNCYAETAGAKFGADVPEGEKKVAPWGPHADRRPVSESTWLAPLAWDRRARRERRRFRVFSGSMCDILDNHRSIAWTQRQRLYDTVEATPNLDWLFLSKRLELARRFLPADWLNGHWPANLWIGATVENQKAAEQRIPHLLGLPAPVRFLSMEPLLGPVDLTRVEVPHPTYEGVVAYLDALNGETFDLGDTSIATGPSIGWVITGGESGRLDSIRDTPDEWMIDVGHQCARAAVPFFAKQLAQLTHRRDYKKFDTFPPELRVRQHPLVSRSIAA